MQVGADCPGQVLALTGGFSFELGLMSNWMGARIYEWILVWASADFQLVKGRVSYSPLPVTNAAVSRQCPSSR